MPPYFVSRTWTQFGGVFKRRNQEEEFVPPVLLNTPDVWAPMLVEGESGSEAGDTTDVFSANEPFGFEGSTNPAAAWFAYIAPSTDTYRFDAVGSDMDTIIDVFGDTAGTLTFIDGNDDGAGLGLISRIDIPLTEGTMYFIRLRGFGSDQGEYVFNWALTP